MLTPQEVSERAFPKASFGGYNMAQVDELLDLLTADYTSLYNENAVMKSKMKVLVEKVEEYRATEDAMRKALMTAQRMADELVKEAEAKKAQILSDAEGEAKERVANIRKQAGDEEFRLSAAQSATAAYVAKVRALHEQELRYLDGLSQLCPAAPVWTGVTPSMPCCLRTCASCTGRRPPPTSMPASAPCARPMCMTSGRRKASCRPGWRPSSGAAAPWTPGPCARPCPFCWAGMTSPASRTRAPRWKARCASSRPPH